MIKQKRILSGILIAVLIAASFSACNMQRELLVGEEKTTGTAAATTTRPAEEATTLPEAQDDEAYITKNRIDTEYEAALKSVRNTKKYEITQDYAQSWKQEMEDNYESLTEKLEGEELELLQTAQKSWESYAKNELKLAYAYTEFLYPEEEEVRMEHNAQAYYDIYRGRAIELYQYRQALPADYGKPAVDEEETTKKK